MTLCVVASNEDAQQQSNDSTTGTMEAAASNNHSTEATAAGQRSSDSQDSGIASQPVYLGQNLRITACANQGGRKYMEDRVHVHVERDAATGALDWTYVAVYDGHGGPEASEYCRRHLLKNIQAEKGFNSEHDADFLDAISSGFLKTHHTMWREVDNWDRTASGYASTAGTTASCAFIRRGKLYVGHVGDSAILLTSRSHPGRYTRLTEDHKPESPSEKRRIEASGGAVMQKAHVHRVVWTRPVAGYVGPLRRDTPTQSIPFLAVARSLGDFWSYVEETQEFAVSPIPDVSVHTLTPDHHSIVLASDGLTNVMGPGQEAAIMYDLAVEEQQQRYFKQLPNEQPNAARILMRRTMSGWRHFRADNVSVLAVVLDAQQPSACSTPPYDEESESASASGSSAIGPKPVDLPKRTCIDTQLMHHPLAMLHVTNEKTTRYETAPVALYYRGARDDNFYSVDSVGPGFVSHDTERNPYDYNNDESEESLRVERLCQYYDMLGHGSRDVTPENMPPVTTTSNLTNTVVMGRVIVQTGERKFSSAAAAVIDELRRDGAATAAAAAANAASVAAAEEAAARPTTPNNRPDALFCVLRSSRSVGKRKSRIFDTEEDHANAADQPSTSNSHEGAEDDDDDANPADESIVEDAVEAEGSSEHGAVLKLALPFAESENKDDDDDGDNDNDDVEDEDVVVDGGEEEGVEGRTDALRTPSPIGDDAHGDQLVAATPICNTTATEREVVKRVTRSAAATISARSTKEMIVVDRPATRRSSTLRLFDNAATTAAASPVVRTPKRMVLEVEDTPIASVASRTRSRAPSEVTPPSSHVPSTSASGSRKRPRTSMATKATPILARMALADENAESDEPLKAGTPTKWKRSNRQPFGAVEPSKSA